MKKIKVCYSRRNNFGNALNPIIIEKVLGRVIEWADPYKCDTSAIGSGLRHLFKSPEYMSRFMPRLKKIIYTKPCQIWSSGFIMDPRGLKKIPIKKQFYISSVRGELSKQSIEEIYEIKLNITTGDGGLLASELIKKSNTKKFSLGIIPHDSEREEVVYEIIKNKISNSLIIDVREDPLEIIKKIAQCECVISSGLHGLIVADSLSVPNKQVILTNKLRGDGFKFKDYYSSFNIQETPIDLNINIDIDIDNIINNYRITSNMVDQKKADIVDAFNKYL